MARALLRIAALASCIAMLGAVASGCGPSLRRVHQGNVYFERCYAADLDTLVPADERRACWQAWHAYYQAGASPERVDHATERLAMLDPAQAEAIALATGSDPILPSSETAAEEASLVQIVSPDSAPEVETIAETTDPALEPIVPDGVAAEETPDGLTRPEPDPMPDATVVENPDTHAAIVEAEERARAVERRSHRAIVSPRSTTPHCAQTCRPLWETCIASCNADESGCIGACRRELTICSRGCY